jgi:hypothetical protein
MKSDVWKSFKSHKEVIQGKSLGRGSCKAENVIKKTIWLQCNATEIDPLCALLGGGGLGRNPEKLCISLVICPLLKSPK